MSNIFDYLDWRGDITFDEVKINKLDVLIFAHLAYSFFDNLVPVNFKKSKPLSRFAADFINAPDYSTRTASTFLKNKRTAELTEATAKTKRFGNVKLTGFRNIYSQSNTEQFAAITYIAGDTAIVAFRGTDDSIAGWHEDFNIGWQNPIAAQKDALDYLNEFGAVFDGKIILAGHSKGGNLAIYAGVNCSARIQKKVEAIYNFDGPGFSESFYGSAKWARVKKRVYSVYPYFSIVGMLFHHPDNFEIVESDSFAVMEHNALSWQVLGSGFVITRNFHKKSALFHKAFNQWIDRLTPEQQKKFVTALFDVFEATGLKTTGEFEDNVLYASKKMIEKLSSVDKESKREVIKVLKIFNQLILKDSWAESIFNFKELSAAKRNSR